MTELHVLLEREIKKRVCQLINDQRRDASVTAFYDSQARSFDLKQRSLRLHGRKLNLRCRLLDNDELVVGEGTLQRPGFTPWRP